MERMKKRKKLTVEEYLDFKENRDTSITCDKLRQIVSMHGGCCVRGKVRKRNLLEIVSALELMDLCRSTLLDDAASGDAYLTETEIISDLDSLDWHERHNTSVLRIGVADGSAPEKRMKCAEKLDVSSVTAPAAYGDHAGAEESEKVEADTQSVTTVTPYSCVGPAPGHDRLCISVKCMQCQFNGLFKASFAKPSKK
ncbi:hypothetical protein M569_06555 [Genlisea aurea]|uniref:DUF7787 domain-containing protein n=1 Tax=Genlisea aurea TaxID=192259 RepID=S8E726_9LAMI|nr:hypothetical protein M569_06555 [Genlisea aurea]